MRAFELRGGYLHCSSSFWLKQIVLKAKLWVSQAE